MLAPAPNPKRTAKTSFIDRLLLPAIVTLTTMIAVLLLFQRLVSEQRVDFQSMTKAQALVVKDKLETELNTRTLPLSRLAARWEAVGPRDDVLRESDAALLISDRGYQAVEWVEPSFRLQWVVPSTSDGAPSAVDLGDDARYRAALEAAKDSGRVTVTRPVELQNGSPGFFICEPLFEGDQLTGFALAAISFQEFVSSTLQESAQRYWVSLSDGREELYNAAASDPPGARVPIQETDVQFRQMTWRARVWPKRETIVDTRSSLAKMVLFGGVLMAGLLGFAVYLGEIANFHSHELAITNRELKKEITVRERAEEALLQAHKMEAVGRLAGGVAHDFNNLLMVIRGHAALALNSSAGNPVREALNEILEGADRASSLTKQLLALGRKQVLQPKILDLNSAIARAADLFSPMLGENILLSLQLDVNAGYIKADPAQVEQVIMNLVFNARDAMPKGGKLTIETANALLDDTWTSRYPEIQPGPHVMLSVRDTGCGMDEQTQLHMFEPFYTTKEQGKGTGLGLATVYGTISQSHGCIVVASKPGEGTTIQIYFPRAEGSIAVSATPIRQPAPVQTTETILVVDDDDAVRRMTIMFLKIKGYTVIEARSPTEAIQFMESDNRSIDLVLTDVSMPTMSGRELADRLIKQRSGLKVLFMSAYTEDAAINSGIHDPGTAFIEKPFSPDDLASKVRQVIAASADRSPVRYLQHHA
jgi:signal transduction histidine kinase/ActR/RegA family two-component response regulator